VEFDLLDDNGDGDDDDDDNVGGNNNHGKDGDDGDKIVGKGGQVDDDDDDESYHDDGEDSELDSEHSEVVVNADHDLDDDEDLVTSGKQRKNETQRRDGGQAGGVDQYRSYSLNDPTNFGCRNTNRCGLITSESGWTDSCA
jgi:hypothetical protein